MPAKDRRRRVVIARRAIHTRWAKCDNPAAATEAARKAALARFERQVDPDSVLDPAIRAQLAADARSAYFADLGERGRAARRLRTEQRSA